ncbi:MAG: hypothetical protein JXD21_04860 [Candidatus Omnitrophica bacterium]|nr:hypothetical protein [Candidatus Omnitrophota bacterium]
MTRKIKRGLKSFTLAEIVVVVGLIGLAAAIFSAVFLGNWIYYDVELGRLKLQEDGERIMSAIEEDVMESMRIDVTDPSQMRLSYPDVFIPPRDDIVYSISESGRLIRDDNIDQVILSRNVSREDSQFRLGSWGQLVCELTFIEDSLRDEIRFSITKEIYPRNIP